MDDEVPLLDVAASKAESGVRPENEAPDGALVSLHDHPLISTSQNDQFDWAEDEPEPLAALDEKAQLHETACEDIATPNEPLEAFSLSTEDEMGENAAPTAVPEERDHVSSTSVASPVTCPQHIQAISASTPSLPAQPVTPPPPVRPIDPALSSTSASRAELLSPASLDTGPSSTKRSFSGLGNGGFLKRQLGGLLRDPASRRATHGAAPGVVPTQGESISTKEAVLAEEESPAGEPTGLEKVQRAEVQLQVKAGVKKLDEDVGRDEDSKFEHVPLTAHPGASSQTTESEAETPRLKEDQHSEVVRLAGGGIVALSRKRGRDGDEPSPPTSGKEATGIIPDSVRYQTVSAGQIS
jgi:hypothetical protein